MAPRKPLGWRNPPAVNGNETAANIGKRRDAAADPADSEMVNGKMDEDEPEYHTDDSADEDDVDGGVPLDQEDESLPYLPAHLLRPAEIKSIEADDPALEIPWEHKTPKQKAGSRRSSRQRKKRQVEGSGVVEAGRAAQVKRGVVTKFPDVKEKTKRVGAKGRVVKPQASGRQQILEARQREVRGVRKAKTKTGGKG
ncbi:hypothetical protein LTS14_000744 [Recurvomyces mirabilis]|uniref:uncharacterized protein n=1 Tax=Recurvomyces mirabilis TaxID=574656 RepID=UPI002DDF87F5|nr:hypothetical protein LTS14_000744 [Recurvomyces mirabilis]